MSPEAYRAAVQDFFSNLLAAHRVYEATIRRHKAALMAVLSSSQATLPGTSEPAYSDDYEMVWSAWKAAVGPRGTKHDGWKAWRTLAPPAASEVVVRGIQLWQRSKEWKGGTFIPHFSTWLSRRSWETVPEPAKNGVATTHTKELPAVDLTTEQAKVEASWRAEWQRRHPERPWPGLETACNVIRLEDESGWDGQADSSAAHSNG